jgi:hypothetical protein
LAGLISGGRLGRLAELQLHWIPVAILAMLVQTVLFTPAVWTAVGDLVPVIYVASMVVALVVVLRNLRRAWALSLVALGTFSNLMAILLNGGFMPVTAEALGVAAPAVARYGGNSVLTADPAVVFLVDRFVMPEWLPFATVYSVGDVLIGIGIVLVIAIAMQPARPDDSRASPGATGAHGRIPAP